MSKLPSMQKEEETITVSIQNSKDTSLPKHRELSTEEDSYYLGLIEAIAFLSTEPIPLGVVARHCQLDRVNTRRLLDILMDEYETRNGGIVLREIAGGYQFITSERYSEDMKTRFESKRRETLSRGVLETLAIICYQQPITLPEIEAIRGVSSRSMVATLLQRNLIKPQGYRPVAGRPTLYVTTSDFLTHFALGSLNDLPSLREVKELEFDDID